MSIKAYRLVDGSFIIGEEAAIDEYGVLIYNAIDVMITTDPYSGEQKYTTRGLRNPLSTKEPVETSIDSLHIIETYEDISEYAKIQYYKTVSNFLEFRDRVRNREANKMKDVKDDAEESSGDPFRGMSEIKH